MTFPGRTPPGRSVYELSEVSTDSFIAGAAVPASGTVSFAVAPPGAGGGADWLVTYIVATLSRSGAASTATSAVCTLYTDSAVQGNLWDQTEPGDAVGVVAWYNPPRRLKASQQLVAVFTAASSGDYAQVRVEYALDTGSQ